MPVKQAFQPEIVPINITEITPIKTMTAASRKTDTYQRIAASMAHVGLIEPLVVFPTTNRKLCFARRPHKTGHTGSDERAHRELLDRHGQ